MCVLPHVGVEDVNSVCYLMLWTILTVCVFLDIGGEDGC